MKKAKKVLINQTSSLRYIKASVLFGYKFNHGLFLIDINGRLNNLGHILNIFANYTFFSFQKIMILK